MGILYNILTSLAYAQRKRPGAIDRIKLIAINHLVSLVLGHVIWFVRDLHGHCPIHIRTVQGDADAAIVKRLLYLGHIQGAILILSWDRRRGNRS